MTPRSRRDIAETSLIRSSRAIQSPSGCHASNSSAFKICKKLSLVNLCSASLTTVPVNAYQLSTLVSVHFRAPSVPSRAQWFQRHWYKRLDSARAASAAVVTSTAGTSCNSKRIVYSRTHVQLVNGFAMRAKHWTEPRRCESLFNGMWITALHSCRPI